MIAVQAEPFDAAALLADFSARAAGAGAIASFTGLVRGENDGAAVTGLELDHHPRLAEQAMAGIGADAVARFALQDVAIVHRYGALAPGEAIGRKPKGHDFVIGAGHAPAVERHMSVTGG